MSQQNLEQATVEELCALAKITAAKVRCRATRWWLDDRDPHRLWIAAVCTPGTDDTIMVMLEARIADPPPQRAQLPDAPRMH